MVWIKNGLVYVSGLPINIKGSRWRGRGNVHGLCSRLTGFDMKREMGKNRQCCCMSLAYRLHHWYDGESYTGQCTCCWASYTHLCFWGPWWSAIHNHQGCTIGLISKHKLILLTDFEDASYFLIGLFPLTISLWAILGHEPFRDPNISIKLEHTREYGVWCIYV